MSTSAAARQHLMQELRDFIARYRMLYPGSRPKASGFIKWRYHERPADNTDPEGNTFQMTWPPELVQTELNLLLKGA